ncbi:MAG: hypothetical protein KDC18_12040, partial [Alphaproteobacteria bacterium]|nr:hypothetical protein [Alphaproteobacteria bacterium]
RRQEVADSLDLRLVDQARAMAELKPFSSASLREVASDEAIQHQPQGLACLDCRVTPALTRGSSQ